MVRASTEVESATRLFWNRPYPLQGHRTGLRHRRRRQESNLHAQSRHGLAAAAIPIKRRLRSLAEGTGLEPASDKRAVVFGTTALPVRLPFHDLAGTLRFELRKSVLETDGLPVSLHPCLRVGACGRTRTYEGHCVRLIYSQVLLLLSHTRT